ncbi:hypothetical protein, partial [Actinomadura sp. NPDC000600]|uniref:hypothetical protein n=1 Tax=Actinomadura sp. NPDC000600 TaxID=3154262 RepID=UPI00339197EA
PAVRGAARTATGLLTAAAGSALARTARDLAARAATAAVEAVLRELLRDALKLALRDSLRGIIAEVSRDVVVDVAKTTWSTATRPAPAGRATAVVIVEASTVETAGPSGDAWADATTEPRAEGPR